MAKAEFVADVRFRWWWWPLRALLRALPIRQMPRRARLAILGVLRTYVLPHAYRVRFQLARCEQPSARRCSGAGRGVFSPDPGTVPMDCDYDDGANIDARVPYDASIGEETLAHDEDATVLGFFLFLVICAASAAAMIWFVVAVVREVA